MNTLHWHRVTVSPLGKNHHKNGSFSEYVEWIELIDKNQNLIRCSRKKNTNLFFNTLGGMGLTGIILNVCFKLIPIETTWVKQSIIPTKNLENTIKLFTKYEHVTYTVAWIDCMSEHEKLGRSLIFLGEHAELKELPDTTMI